MHIAFKTTYNDGGEGPLVGFSGICSKENTIHNIENRRVWCSNDGCKCMAYYRSGFTGEKPERPCMESWLFTDWEYDAGYFHNGNRKGQRKNLKNVAIGDICILTTRYPGSKEHDRKITGLFVIGGLKKDRNAVYGVIADDKYKVRLSLKESKQLNFWDYFTTRGGAVWGAGLQRYMNQQQVYSLLKGALKIVEDPQNKRILLEILKEKFRSF